MQYTAECPSAPSPNDTALTQIHFGATPAARMQLDLLEEYRRRRGEVFRAKRAAKDAAAAAAVVDEWAAEIEGQFARSLRRNGPIVLDGRHYSAKEIRGVLRVEVRSAEGRDL